MKKLKCGVVGGGILGKVHLKACTQFPYAQPVAICDINGERAKEAAEEFDVEAYTDYEDMIDKADLDVIHIATPDFAHRDPVIKSLQSGKHVLVEKPMATTMDDARAIAEAAKAADGKLMVNFSNRWNVPHHNDMPKHFSPPLLLRKHWYQQSKPRARH